MTLTELDTIRAETMKQYLDDEGLKEIWKYDIITRKVALGEARYNCDFDNMEFALNTTKPYALVGYGICDTYFETIDELKEAVRWLCCDSYLSCYKRTELS